MWLIKNCQFQRFEPLYSLCIALLFDSSCQDRITFVFLVFIPICDGKKLLLCILEELCNYNLGHIKQHLHISECCK